MNGLIYEKNMNALRKRFPGMADIIDRKKIFEEMKHQVLVEQAADGTPILNVRQEERVLYLGGKREPRQVAKRIIERWGELNSVASVFVVGMGNVAFLTELLEHTEKTTNIMVYEPSLQIFQVLMQQVDISIYFENRAIGLVIEGLNEYEMEPVIKTFLNVSNVEFMKSHVCANYSELFSEKVLHFLKSLDRISTTIISNYNTAIRFATVEADNLFHNIGYLCDGSITIQLCDVLPTDIPAIIVSAGPSLNKNIMELRKAKNRAFIVAVDTAVKPLVKAGIIPDLYVVVDGLKPVELLDFEEAKRIPMMPSLTSSKEILQQHKGKKIFFFDGEILAYNIMAMNGVALSALACGGSVACSAFSLVYKLGFSRIILVGQDLAFTGNRTHADGTFKEIMDEVDTSCYQMVRGNCEEWVPTRSDYKMYLDWFNYYIAGCEDIHVINATEGGARIDNTEIMPLAEAIERECSKEVDIAACFAKLQPVLGKEQRKRAVEYLNSIPKMFLDLKKDIKKEKEYYCKLQKICKNTRLDNTAYLQVLNRIKKTTKRIMAHDLYSIVTRTLAVGEYLISSEQFYQEDTPRKEGLEIARKGIQYTDLMEQCIDILILLAEDTVAKIK